MNEFWLWFIRPFAEIAAVFVLAVGSYLLLLVYIKLGDWMRRRK